MFCVGILNGVSACLLCEFMCMCMHGPYLLSAVRHVLFGRDALLSLSTCAPDLVCYYKYQGNLLCCVTIILCFLSITAIVFVLVFVVKPLLSWESCSPLPLVAY